MRVMILLAHGSRREESAQEIKDMAKELSRQAVENDLFDIVKPAFIQFCGPDFFQVVDEIIKNDLNNDLKQVAQTEIVVFPYFISAGNHVAEDIPDLVSKASAKYPQISFKVTTHLGKFQGLKKLILEESIVSNK